MVKEGLGSKLPLEVAQNYRDRALAGLAGARENRYISRNL